MLIVDVWSPNQNILTRSRKWDNFPPNSDAKYPLSFLKISTHQFLIFVDFVLKNPSQTPSWFIQTRCYFILLTVIVLMLFLETTYTVPLMMPFNRN